MPFRPPKGKHQTRHKKVSTSVTLEGCTVYVWYRERGSDEAHQKYTLLHRRQRQAGIQRTKITSPFVWQTTGWSTNVNTMETFKQSSKCNRQKWRGHTGKNTWIEGAYMSCLRMLVTAVLGATRWRSDCSPRLASPAMPVPKTLSGAKEAHRIRVKDVNQT